MLRIDLLQFPDFYSYNNMSLNKMALYGFESEAVNYFKGE